MNETIDQAPSLVPPRDIAAPVVAETRGELRAACHDARNLIAEVEHVLARATGIASADVDRVRSQINAALVAARSNLVETQVGATQRLHDATAKADVYLHESPWQATLIAGVAGLAIDMLLARRS